MFGARPAENSNLIQMRMTRRLTAKFRDDRMEIQGRRVHTPPKVCLPGWMVDREGGARTPFRAYRYYFNVFIDRFCNRGTVSRVDLQKHVFYSRMDGKNRW